jgi:hypothetical protein
MNKKVQAPFVAVLAAELTVIVLGGAIVLWVAQDIIVKALQFVLPTMAG